MRLSQETAIGMWQIEQFTVADDNDGGAPPGRLRCRSPPPEGYSDDYALASVLTVYTAYITRRSASKAGTTEHGLNHGSAGSPGKCWPFF
jgi:hypothetical protein